MSRFALIRREFGSLSREKTIVFALVIQLVVAGFSSFLVVGLTTMYDPSATAQDVAVGVTGDQSDRLVTAAASVDGVDVERYDDPGAAETAFLRNEVQALALVEPDTDTDRIRVTVQVPRASLQRTLVVVQIRDLLEALERIERTDRRAHLAFDPAPLPPEVDGSPYFGFTYAILVPLLVFLPVFIGGAVVVDSITEEIERGTIELLRVAPLSFGEILAGKAALHAVLVPTQVVLWFLLLGWNDIAIKNVEWLLVFASAVAVLAVACGIALAVALPRRSRAQMIYSFGALSLFAVGAVLPEHPATTVARLAIGSATAGTYTHVVGYVATALVAVALLWAWIERVDPETVA